MNRPRSELDAHLELLAKAAREAGVDPRADDLAPSRPLVWLLAAWFCIVVVFALLFTGCGGGIDTADEFMGPPPPRPCPVDVSACHPKPGPG